MAGPKLSTLRRRLAKIASTTPEIFPSGDTPSWSEIADKPLLINPLRTTANQTINAGKEVFTDITGLTFPVVAGTDYAFEFYIVFRSASTNTGWGASVNCPAGTLDYWITSQTTLAHISTHSIERDSAYIFNNTIAQAVDLGVRISGRYLCTENGVLAARFANELANNTHIVVQKGSWGTWF